jgi:hypothetical protein
MIALPIDQSSIDNPRRIDVGRIAEVMLWPCDEETRAKAMLVEQCLWDRSLLEQGQLLPSEIAALAKAGIDAPAAADMAKANAKVFVNGYVAGLILHNAVSAAEKHPKDAAIQATVKRISESFGLEWRLRPQTINNHIWPRYRPVAHLWAAFVFSEDDVFPCRHPDLGTFLAKAEAYRELGENTRTRHSRSAVLRPGESAELPAGLRLPVVKLRFEPLW